jgi:hypothetical protein
LIMAHARFRGWIVERKQVAQARLDLGHVSMDELDARIAHELDLLEPGIRADIERQVAELHAKRSRVNARRFNAPSAPGTPGASPAND